MLELPPSALQGLAGWADAELAKVASRVLDGHCSANTFPIVASLVTAIQ